MSMTTCTALVPTLLRRFSVFATLAAPVALLLGGCASPAASTDAESVGEARQRITTCVTYQRGTHGTVADTRLASNHLAVNYGADDTLPASQNGEILVQADLSEVPSHAVVSSAALQLYINATGNGQATGVLNGNGLALGLGNGSGNNIATLPINLHRATAAWTEATATYSSFNQQFDSTIAGVIQPAAAGTLKSVDITALVQEWVSGSKPNYGVLLKTGDNKTTYFVSSESAGTTLRPALAVCYSVPDDHCTPSPCENGGTCVNGWEGYTCECAAGYSGTDCETNIDDCADNPCLNGGNCTDGLESYSCSCAAGFSGDNCETNINECAANPCLNGGVCTDGVNSYSCVCPPGFAGDNCQTNIDDCAGSPCQNGGTCSDQVNGYSCACATGFTGVNCEANIDDCAGNSCQNGASCIDGVASYTCACLPGFSGTYCETNIDDCAGAPCLHDGICTDLVNGYSCECAAGYAGDNCEVDIDDCAVNACQNGGLCVDGVNGFTCQCPSGWSGALCDQPEVATCPCSGEPLWQSLLANSGFLVGLVYGGNNGVALGSYDHSATAAYYVETMNGEVVDTPFAPPSTCGVLDLDQNMIEGHTGLTDAQSDACMQEIAPAFFAWMDACSYAPCGSAPGLDSLWACRPDGAGHECYCDGTYTSTDCYPSTPCDANPCVNGLCGNNGDGSGYTCACDAGWTGTNCDEPEVATCPCSGEPLWQSLLANSGFLVGLVYGGNNGVALGSYDHSATAAYYVETMNGEVVDTPFAPPSTCGVLDLDQNMIEGHTGLTDAQSDACMQEIAPAFFAWMDACSYAPCGSAPGLDSLWACRPDGAGHECYCDGTYTSTDCYPSTPCDANPCVNGLCGNNGDGSGYTCACDAGWTGTNCDEPAAVTCPCTGLPGWNTYASNAATCGYFYDAAAAPEQLPMFAVATADGFSATVILDPDNTRGHDGSFCVSWGLEVEAPIQGGLSPAEAQACIDDLRTRDAAGTACLSHCAACPENCIVEYGDVYLCQ